MEKSRILVVDDEQKIREVVRIYLEKEGFTVGEAADGKEALNMIASVKWNLVVLDLMMQTSKTSPTIMSSSLSSVLAKVIGHTTSVTSNVALFLLCFLLPGCPYAPKHLSKYLPGF